MRVFLLLCEFLLLSTLVSTISRSQTHWTKYSANPVLDGGARGSWDNHAFFPSVLYRDSSYTMWYSGRTEIYGSKYQTGRATSSDGIHWTKDSLNPVMSFGSTGSWDEYGAWIPQVLFYGNQYRMWYTGASATTFGVWQLGEATSLDGRSWQKNSLNPVLNIGSPGSWESGSINRNAILFDGSIYKMWYTGMDGSYPSQSEGVGYATSIDGTHWTKFAQNPILVAGPAGSWDDHYVGVGCVLYDSGYYHMWFDGNESAIGYAVSKDGIHWKEFPGNPVVRGGNPGGWEDYVWGSCVRQAGPFFQMWYMGENNSGKEIGYATSPRSAATIELSNSSIDFGNVQPGTVSDTISINVSNWGLAPLRIASLVCSRAEFVLPDVSSLPLTIQPFEEMQIPVAFHPLQAGKVVQDTLVVISNDSSNSRVSIALRGRGSGSIQPAAPGTLYGFSATHAGAQLFEINKATGVATPISRLTPHPPGGPYGFTIRPFDNMMYAANSSSTQTVLYRLSSALGDLEPIGNIPVGNVTAMAFSAGDNLYLADSTGKLYSSRVKGGVPTLLGQTGRVFTGLAFSPATHAFWASAHDSLYTVDTITAQLTFVGSSGANDIRSSLTFDALGNLYGMYDNILVKIDKVTGFAASIGNNLANDAMAIATRTSPQGTTNVSVGLVPRDWKLYQSYPNPFNPTTTIRYDVPGETLVSLKVYDALGREVAALVNEVKTAGQYECSFNASHLSSGVYYYRLQAGMFVETKKLMLLR